MDSILIAEWKKAYPHCFVAIRLDLPGKTLRLTSGGTVVFTATDHDGGTAEQTFVPEDSDYGVLSYVGEIEDGEIDEASAPDLGFEAYTDAGIEGLSAAEAQGSKWTLYWGTVNPSTGAVVGSPEELFTARLNVPTLAIEPSGRRLQFSNYTEEQFQLLDDASQRLSNSSHQRAWPGELGLSLIPDVTRKIYWRLPSPRRSIRTGGGGGGSNQGGGNRNLF